MHSIWMVLDNLQRFTQSELRSPATFPNDLNHVDVFQQLMKRDSCTKDLSLEHWECSLTLNKWLDWFWNFQQGFVMDFK